MKSYCFVKRFDFPDTNKIFLWNRLVDLRNVRYCKYFGDVEVKQDENDVITRKIYVHECQGCFIEKFTKIDCENMVIKYKIIFNETSLLRKFTNFKCRISIYYNDEDEDCDLEWKVNYDLIEGYDNEDVKYILTKIFTSISSVYFDLVEDDGEEEDEEAVA